MPTLPLEVLGLVIDTLSNEPTRSKMQDLRSLSLVCKDFVPFCQSQIFRRIHRVGFYGGEEYENSEMGRTIRLVMTFENNPSLLPLVRELNIQPHCESGSGRPNKRYSNMFFKFPNLTHLTFLYYSHYLTGNAGQSFRGQMIEHYISQKTLRYISITDLQDFDYNRVFGCQTMEALHSVCMSIPPTFLPTSSISRLSITSAPRFPLSVLEYLPHLRSLTLKEVQTVTVGLQNTGAPSMMLNVLSLDLVVKGSLSILLDHYYNHGEKAGLRPFGALKRLVLKLRDESDAYAIQPMLDGAKQLRSLLLTSTATYISLASINLEHHVRHSFPDLTNLNLTLNADPYHSAYVETMAHLHSLFTTISGTNQLENINLTVQSGILTVPRIDTTLWSILADLLASPAGFPVLKRVTASLAMSVDLNTRTYLAEVLKYDYSSFISDPMVALKERLGDNFKEEFHTRRY